MKEWIEIGGLSDIPPLGARVVHSEQGDIAVFRSAGDDIFAVRDQCPHKGGPLSQGIMHGSQVTCPLHNWVIDLATGEAVEPDVGCVGRYQVKCEAGRIYLAVSAAGEKLHG
jgi:nitrite reductase (NADH) small subunit